MALFNLRWPGRAAQDDGKRPARQRRAVSTESVDALRRRARHRLIGAAVLLVAGVVGFPLLFDTQPRPIPVDIPIVIPERGQSAAQAMAAVAAASAPAAPAAPSAASPAPAKPAVAAAKPSVGSASTADSLDKGEEIVASAPAKPEKSEKPEKPERSVATTPIPLRPPVKPAEPHREAAAPAKPAPAAPAVAARDDDAARARALLDGKPLVASAAPAAAPAASAAPATNADARFVVQVGAFGDAGKAQEARAKLTRGGLKTYVQSIETKDGPRIRVRVGPFANKAEADKAAARVKGLDLPASVLTL